MSFASASVLLFGATLKNRVLRQLRRLRQPKYIVATTVALAYFWFLVVRRASLPPTPAEVRAQALAIFELLVAFLGLGFVLATWLFGKDEAVLHFSEAEVQFLFPAPVSRRALLHFKLLKVLAATSLSALIPALLFGYSMTGHPLLFGLGIWMAIATLSFHTTAAALTRRSLVEHGVAGLRRRLWVLGVVGAVLACLAGWIVRVSPPPAELLASGDLDALASYVRALLEAPPLSYVLWPARAVVAPAFAPDGWAFLLRLGPALAILALHYAWAVSSNVQFEEAAVESAERRAQRAERRGQRAAPTFQRRRPPFVLTSRGAPAAAIFWKNLTAATRSPTFGKLLKWAPLLVLVVTVLRLVAPRWFLSPTAVVLAQGVAMLLLFLVLTGPQVARYDLRLDLKDLEGLRALPLGGMGLSLAATLASVTVLTLLAWAGLALLWLLLSAQGLLGLSGVERAAIALAAAVALPPLFAANVTVQSVAGLLFPDWLAATPKERAGGLELFGTRLLVMLGTWAVLGVAALPGALLAALTLWLASPWGVATASVLAGVAAAGGMGLPVLAGQWLLGRLLDRFDPTE